MRFFLLLTASAALALPAAGQFDPSFDPPLAVDINPDPDIFEMNLTAAPLAWEFTPGTVTQAKGFNGAIPGPMVDVKVGDTLIVHFTNNLGEPTTIHWHGVDAPADMDGSHIAQLSIPDGGTFTYQFDLLTPGLKWYHPHVRTDVMIEHGLYGAILVRNPLIDAALGIQGEEHVIMFDDISLDGAGEFDSFLPSDPLERAIYNLSGRVGNMLILNGKQSSTRSLSVTNGAPQRWWVVNVANSTFSRLDLAEYYMNVPANVCDPQQDPANKWTGDVYQIGGDRGFLSGRYKLDPVVEVIPAAEHFIFEDFRGILLTPGERMEVNFTPFGADGEVLRVDQWDWARGDHVAFYMPDGVNIGLGDDPQDGFRPVRHYFDMTLVGPDPGPPYYAPPKKLVPLADPIQLSEVTKTVTVTMGHAPPTPAGDVTFFVQAVGGNPTPMAKMQSLAAYDFVPGDVVLWEIHNLSHGDHPFHTHGWPFQWFEVEYIDNQAPENNYKEFARPIEPKDTVLVPARPGAFMQSRTILRALMRITDTGREGQIFASGKNPSASTSGRASRWT